MNLKKSILKKILSLISYAIIFSCSNNDSINTDNSQVIEKFTDKEGEILRSYIQKDISSTYEHFFENNGSRYEKILRRNKTRYLQYVYDLNNRMIKIIFLPDDIYTNNQTIFYYDNLGKIIKMEKDKRLNGTNGVLKTWLFTYIQNTVIQEFVSDQDPNYNDERIRYIFDDEGLLMSRHEYTDSPNNSIVNTIRYTTFKYDINKNIISLKQTERNTHDLPNSPTDNLETFSILYEYDDKINPLQSVYLNHYQNYLFNDEFLFNLQSESFQNRVLSVGKNNLKRTIFPNNSFFVGVTIDNLLINNFIYQTNNLPKKMSRVSTENNNEFLNITFNY